MDAYMNWPLAGLILGLAAIFVFRADWKSLLKRVSRLGKDGAAFDGAQPQESTEQKLEQPAFAELMRHPVSASVLRREELIRTEMAHFNEPEKVQVLQRAVAMSRVELDFTRVSNIIFGTQLALMVRLAGSTQGLTRAQAEEAFAQAQKAWPTSHADRTVDEWMAFLVTHGLIEVLTDRIELTAWGADFLKFLVDARLAHDRPG